VGSGEFGTSPEASPWEILEHGEDLFSRLEALGKLEVVSRGFQDPVQRERVEGLLGTVPHDLEEALLRALVRSLRAEYFRGAGEGLSPGVRAKNTLADQLLLEQGREERMKFIAASLQEHAFETLPVLVRQFKREDDHEVAALLAKALGVLGDKRVLPLLKKASRSDSVAIRLGAIEGLSFQGGRGRTQLLLERLVDPEAEITKAARKELLRLPLGDALDILEAIPDDKGAKLRRAAVKHLASYPGRPRVCQLLERYMHSGNSLVAAESLLVLAGMGEPVAMNRIKDLEGSADKRMRKVLGLAKKAYDKAVASEYEAVSDLLAGAQSAVQSYHSDPPLDPVLSPPGPDPASPQDLAFRDTFIGPAPVGTGTVPVCEEPPPAAPGAVSLSILNTVVSASEEPARKKPVELGNMLPDLGPSGDNPWDSVILVRQSEEPGGAPGSSSAVPQAGLVTPEMDPSEDEEEPIEPFFEIPTSFLEDSAPSSPEEEEFQEPHFDIPVTTPGTSLPKVDAAPASTSPVSSGDVSPLQVAASLQATPSRLSFRLLFLLFLVGGAGIAGIHAYRVGVAAKAADKQQEQLATDFSKLARAIKKARARSRQPYLDQGLASLVPKYLPKLGRDPWGGAYGFDPTLDRLFSFGPDGVLNQLASPDSVGTPSDDRSLFLGEPPEPLVVSVQKQGKPYLLAFRPGETRVVEVHLTEEEVSPVRPVFALHGGRLAYLIFSPEQGKYLGMWRRLVVGKHPDKKAPEPVLPVGWDTSSLAWFPGGEELAVIATPPGAKEGVFRVKIGEVPRRLPHLGKDLAEVTVSRDGKRIAWCATDQGGTRRVVFLGLSSLAAAPAWGPVGEHPCFGRKGVLLYCGVDPRQAGRSALFGLRIGQERGDLLQSSPRRIASPMPSVRGDKIAYIEGNKVKVLNLSTRTTTPVFHSSEQILALAWPLPGKIGDQDSFSGEAP
jgi:hypothetical protein